MSNFKIIDLLKQFRIKTNLFFTSFDGVTKILDISAITNLVKFPTMTIMNFKGEYLSGTQYLRNDVVNANGYLSQAKIDTETNPEPIPVGLAENSIDKSDTFVVANNTSVIRMMHRFTSLKNGFIQTLEVYTPHYDLDSVAKVTYKNVTTGQISTLDRPILSGGNWNLISNAQQFIKVGDVIEVWFEFYNSVAANAISGGWDSNQGAGAPANQEFNMDNLITPTVIEIDYTDLDNTDRQTELDGVVQGSIVRITERDDVNRNIEFEIDTIDATDPNSVKYTVLPDSINNGAKEIRDNRTCTIHIDVPITQPSEFVRILDYYPANDPSWATIETELYFGDVLQPDLSGDDAYGINIQFQEMTLSPDWNIVSVSEGAGGIVTSTYVFSKVTNLLNVGDVYVPLTSITETGMKVGSIYELKMSVRGTFVDVNDSMYIRYRIIDGVTTGTWNEFVHQSKSADDTWIFNYFFPRTATNTTMTLEMEVRKETGGQQLDVLFANAIIDEKI